MPGIEITEKSFESDIEAFFLSKEGGYSKSQDEYDPKLGVFKEISFTDFSNFKLPLPPAEEQEEIALWIESKCDEIESLIKEKRQLVNELETYKKTLVYEYVTGKKGVHD